MKSYVYTILSLPSVQVVSLIFMTGVGLQAGVCCTHVPKAHNGSRNLLYVPSLVLPKTLLRSFDLSAETQYCFVRCQYAFVLLVKRAHKVI